MAGCGWVGGLRGQAKLGWWVGCGMTEGKAKIPRSFFVFLFGLTDAPAIFPRLPLQATVF